MTAALSATANMACLDHCRGRTALVRMPHRQSPSRWTYFRQGTACKARLAQHHCICRAGSSGTPRHFQLRADLSRKPCTRSTSCGRCQRCLLRMRCTNARHLCLPTHCTSQLSTKCMTTAQSGRCTSRLRRGHMQRPASRQESARTGPDRSACTRSRVRAQQACHIDLLRTLCSLTERPRHRAT